MLNNRVLIVVNSVYQLFTAVHIRRTILEDRDVDLLLTDVLPQGENYLPRLEDTGLFERVLFARTRELNQTDAGASGEKLSEGFRDIPKRFRWILSDELTYYVEIYFSNFDPFLRMLACQYYTLPCEFVCYEDGFSSYVIDYLREDRAAINRHPEGQKIRDKVESVFLYEPRLAVREDGLVNRRLPKIKREDQELRTLFNYIFDYQSPEEDADFLFLEQSFRAEGLETNDVELMELCQETVGAGRFVVKPHPRNPENIPFQLGLTRKYSNSAPWELYLLNEDMRDKTILTVCSNAALTGRIVFQMDIPTVMLYPLFEGKVLWKEDALLRRYLRKFQRQFAGEHYYVPQTAYELKHILTYLGGRHEQSSKGFCDYSSVPGGELSGAGGGFRFGTNAGRERNYIGG